MNKIFILGILCVIVFTLAQCARREQQQTQERTEGAVNDAFSLTTKTLKNVAEGVNDAVYK